MGDLRDKTLTGVKWSAIERFSNQLVRFLVELVLARLLLPTDYGIIGMIGVFLAISQSFVDSGFSSALIRKKTVTDADNSTVFYFNIFVGILTYGILFLSAPLIAEFFFTPILVDVMRVISILLIFNSLTVVHIANLTRDIDFRTQSKASLTSSVISGFIGIILAYNGYGVWALVYQSVSAAFINMVLLWIYSKWKPKLLFSWTSFKELFGFGGKILLSGLLHTIYVQLTTLVIGKFYNSKSLGLYTRGEKFASFPSTNLSSVIQRVTYPLLSKFQDDYSALILLYRKYIKLSSMLIIFVMALIAALGKPLVIALLTSKWEGAIIYLQILCFAYMFDHIDRINVTILQVIGRSDLTLKVEVLKKAISIAILLISIPYGVLAICLSKLLYSQIALVFNTYYTGKIFHFGYMKQIIDIAPYFTLSIISVLPAFFLGMTDLNPFIVLSLGFLSALFIYVICLLLVRDTLFKNYVLPLLSKKGGFSQDM